MINKILIALTIMNCCFSYANEKGIKEIYNKKNLMSEIGVFFEADGLSGAPTCEISKKTKNGFLALFINNKHDVSLFTNSTQSYEVFDPKSPVKLSIVDPLSGQKLFNKIDVYPLGDKRTSRYVLEYPCKKDKENCIGDYINNTIYLSSGNNIVFFDAFNKVLDSDAISAFYNCMDEL